MRSLFVRSKARPMPFTMNIPESIKNRKARRAAQSKAKGQKHVIPSRPNKSGKTFDR